LAELAAAQLAELAPTARLADDAIDALRGMALPGNVRELRSLLTRAWVGCLTDQRSWIHGRDLRSAAGSSVPSPAVQSPAQPPAPLPVGEVPAVGSYGSALRLGADYQVKEAYERLRNVSAVARELRISRSTVYRHLHGSVERELPKGRPRA
jgi:transcriptional regulator with PAS, ATPase and Fis domain